jgi:hypothetical protein
MTERPAEIETDKLPQSAKTNAAAFRLRQTVYELDLFQSPGLLFERKQIPQAIVNVRISRNAMELLEATNLPWAHDRHVFVASLTPSLVGTQQHTIRLESHPKLENRVRPPARCH